MENDKLKRRLHNLYKTLLLILDMKKESVSSNDNSFGIASVVFGVVSLTFAIGVLFGSFAGLVLGLVGLFFALAQRKRAPNKWSKAGLVLNIISLVINGVFLALLIKTLVAVVQEIQSLEAAGLLSGVA